MQCDETERLSVFLFLELKDYVSGAETPAQPMRHNLFPPFQHCRMDEGCLFQAVEVFLGVFVL